MGIILGKYMLSAVTRAVAAEFGGAVEVYNETPVQGAALPYLFIAPLRAEQRPDGWRRHNRNELFDIRYHPDDKQGSANAAIADVRERLFCCLTLIDTADWPARANSIRAETIDGVLHVFAEYAMRVLAAKPDDPSMRTLDIAEGIKETEE